MINKLEVTSIILAGGKNLRLGKSKALVTIGGQTMIERVIRRLEPISSHILIVAAQEQSQFEGAGEARVLPDLYRDRGPLGGIYTGLLASLSFVNLVVACDMPFLNIELLRYLIKQSPGFDAVVPRLDEDKLEPLHAIYAKSCLDKMKRWLDNGQLGANSFLRTINVRYVELGECQQFEPQLTTFFNVNYPSDLERANSLAAGQIEE